MTPWGLEPKADKFYWARPRCDNEHVIHFENDFGNQENLVDRPLLKP